MKKIPKHVKASWNYERQLLCGGDTEVKNKRKRKSKLKSFQKRERERERERVIKEQAQMAQDKHNVGRLEIS